MSFLRKTAILLVTGLMGIFAITAVYSAARQELFGERLSMAGFAIVCATLTISLALYLRNPGTRERDRNLRDPMATLVITGPLADRRRHLFFSLGVGIGSALIAASGLNDSLNQASAILLAMMFGVAAPAFLLTRPKPRRLAFSLEGIDYSFFNFGPVAWSDLKLVFYSGRPRNAMVLLVADEEKYLTRLSEGDRNAVNTDRHPMTKGFPISARDLGVQDKLLNTAMDVRMAAFRDRLTSYDDDYDDEDDKDSE